MAATAAMPTVITAVASRVSVTATAIVVMTVISKVSVGRRTIAAHKEAGISGAVATARTATLARVICDPNQATHQRHSAEHNYH